MVVAVAVWSLELIPGDPTVIQPPADLRITGVALGDELADETGRTTIKFGYRAPSSKDSDDEDSEDEEKEDEDDEGDEIITGVLCSLTPGKIEQAQVDLILEEDQEYLFETVGAKNVIYLSGNYIDQAPRPFGDEEEGSELDEEDFDLQDVSSDVEIDPEDIELEGDEDDSHRFEEVVEEKKSSKKRPRESDGDAMETDEKLSAKAQKKLNKKLKAEGGGAVPTGTDEAPKANGEEKKEKKKDKKEKKAEKEGKEGKEGVEKKKKETQELAGGIKILDHKAGTGPQAKAGDFLAMRYVGKLQNGSIFDSNTKGKPFTFRLGKGEVIKGWDIGIAGMQAGGERLLTIPAPMAYGKQKQAGIPANSTLIFEVKLLKVGK